VIYIFSRELQQGERNDKIFAEYIMLQQGGPNDKILSFTRGPNYMQQEW
jgi:hypothetical protein